MKDEFYFPSKDGNTEIHTIEWKPEGDVKAILQISHGMVEYIDRYREDVYKRQLMIYCAIMAKEVLGEDALTKRVK